MELATSAAELGSWTWDLAGDGSGFSKPNSPIPDRGDGACLTARSFSRIFAPEKKGSFKILTPLDPTGKALLSQRT
jgi:hypothetical protein